MPKRCCKQCGRDTNSTYCSSCSPYYNGRTGHEQKIRKNDTIDTHDDDLLLDEDTGVHDFPSVKVDPYHGSTSRDDI